jgi:hypothetical protein
VNRTQLVLLGFTACSWIALVVILIAAPDVYDAELKPLGLAGLVEARLAFLVTPGSRPPRLAPSSVA